MFFFATFLRNVVSLVFPGSRCDLRRSLLSWSSNLSSFCYVVTTVLDDAPPGTQEYIMLRQDSIQSAELKKKESPFRAKCHEIFCCPLKQVHHKENTEPEGLCTTDACFCLFSLVLLSFSFFLTVHCPSGVLCVVRPGTELGGPWLAGECVMQAQMEHCIIQSSPARRAAASCFSQLNLVQLLSLHCPILAAQVACSCSRHLAKSVPITLHSWNSSRLRNDTSKVTEWEDGSKFSDSPPLHKASALCLKNAHDLLSRLKQALMPRVMHAQLHFAIVKCMPQGNHESFVFLCSSSTGLKNSTCRYLNWGQ